MKYDESGSKLALKWQLITSLSRIYQNLSPYSTLDPSLILTCQNHEKSKSAVFKLQISRVESNNTKEFRKSFKLHCFTKTRTLSFFQNAIILPSFETQKSD